MRLWNREFTKSELMRHIGDISSVCWARRAVLDDGPGRGMRIIEVYTGSGLSFSVLPDRGMDIGWCHYNSIPISFISKTGVVAPGLCEYGGNGFLRGFTAELLTTCGYTHMGAACVDEGIPLGLHGRANMLVADNVSVDSRWENNDYVIKITGVMREAAVFGENLQLRREITVKAGENTVWIYDELENYGFEPSPLMMLYHMNFGYPFVSAASELVSSEFTAVRPRDDEASTGLDMCHEFQPPTHKYNEQVFYHDLVPDKDGYVFAGISNPELGVIGKVRFKKSELPYLVQWKQMGEGDYACGIEPGTWLPEGRNKARERGELGFIGAGEKRDFSLDFTIGAH